MSRSTERQSGWYWVIPFRSNIWVICHYDANWDEWVLNGESGVRDDEFEKIDPIKLIRI